MRAMLVLAALIAVAACAGVVIAIAASRPSDEIYVRPRMGSWSGATMWGATALSRPRVQAKVLEVALADERARSILGRDYRVTGDASLGNGVLIHVNLLGKPRSYELDLPYSSYGTVDDPPEECRLPNYVMGWYHDKARRATAAAITVDLRKRQVIDVMTLAAHHETSWVPGKPHPACPFPRNP